MTEEEAKTKWCPFVRHTSSNGEDHAANRWGKSLSPEDCRCIGSQCAAWRWIYREHRGPNSMFPSRDEKTDRGFCGLAGKP